MRPQTTLVAVLALLALPCSLHAEDHPATRASERAPRGSTGDDVSHHPPNHVVGLKLVGTQSNTVDHSYGFAGGGLIVERAFFHHRLEVELTPSILRGSHGTEIPVALLAKAPYHLGGGTNLYAGAGCLLLTHIGEGAHAETNVYAGGTAVVGAHVWLAKHFGLQVEVVSSVVLEETVAWEAEADVGVIARF